MATKEILGIIPTMQSLALASYAYGNISNKRKKKKKLIGNAFGIMAGASLIKATSETL